MDTKEKVNDEQKRCEDKFDFPFGSSREMREMMKSCCGNGALPSDCRSMMGRMMEFHKGHETNEGQAPEKATK
jgi:hypothetical protein